MSGVQSVEAPKDESGTFQAILQLTKPRVTRLVVATSLCGGIMAPGPAEPSRLILSLLATAVVVGSANALNMYLERESDAAMERTRMRPLPSGRLSPDVALWFGILSGALGLLLLALVANVLAAALAAIAWLCYVLVYTPLKSVTSLALFVGAVPGALPPLIGWAAMAGSLDATAFSVFAFLFVWQIPHFLAIAVFRRDEYKNAGIQVLPAVHGIQVTKTITVVTALLATFVSAVPYLVGFLSTAYLVVALVFGTVFVAWAAAGFWSKNPENWARSLFFASLPYLVLVYGIMVAAAA